MSEYPAVTAARRAGAHDGRAASARIDRVEARLDEIDAANEARLRRNAALVVRAVGPDVLLAQLGREAALELLEQAGEPADQIAAQWDQQEAERRAAAPQQVSTRFGTDDQNNPRYDPRFLDAVMHGASPASERQILAQITAEYDARKLREHAEAERRTGFMWTDGRTGRARYANTVPLPLGAAADPYTGNPQQRSLVNDAVPPLGSEPVPPPYMGDVREVETSCTGHDLKPGEKYCPTCERKRERQHDG